MRDNYGGKAKGYGCAKKGADADELSLSASPCPTAVGMGSSGDAVPRRSSRNGALIFGIAVFIVSFFAVLGCSFAIWGDVDAIAIVVALMVATLACSSLHVALSWERVVILRLVKVNRVAGPGVYATIPVIEHGTMRVDQRTMCTTFYAERTLTADLIPVSVDAVLYWIVRDAEQACTEVGDYYVAVTCLAQTALREAVGRKAVAEVALARNELDIEIEEDVARISSDWGIDIIAVKVRDIVSPEELQESMSLEARADRERNARMTVASVEADLAEALSEAAKIYADSENAMKLRTMLMQYETVNESGGTVVTVPTAVSDGFAEGVQIR